MKKVLLGLAILSTQGAFALERDFEIPGNRMDLTQCLKTLHNSETTINDLKLQLNQCLVGLPGQGQGRIGGGLERENELLKSEVDALRRDALRLNEDNSRLSIDNSRLLSDNRRQQDEIFDLKRQLDDLRGPRTLGFFSYAGCKSYNGSVDTKYLSSATGMFPIESESNAQIQTAKDYSCTYGIGVVKTEEIKSSNEANYCVAGCADYTGKVDTKYIIGARGRNLAEAEYNSMKEVSKKYSCTYGIKIQACQ
ncbi:MAG: hypothetical protein ACXVLQ_17205 [Bacteriovorax sp.]